MPKCIADRFFGPKNRPEFGPAFLGGGPRVRVPLHPEKVDRHTLGHMFREQSPCPEKRAAAAGPASALALSVSPCPYCSRGGHRLLADSRPVLARPMVRLFVHLPHSGGPLVSYHVSVHATKDSRIAGGLETAGSLKHKNKAGDPPPNPFA